MTGDALESEVARLEKSSGFAAEWQITAAGFWANVQIFLGVAAAALAAVSSGTAFSEESVIAGSLAAAAALAAAVLASLQPGERAERHQQAAAEYHALAVKARHLRIFGPSAGQDAVDAFNQLRDGVLQLDADSPWAPRRLATRTHAFLDSGLRYYDNEGHAQPPARRSRGPVSRAWSLRRQARARTPN